jgi:hypothetical protein
VASSTCSGYFQTWLASTCSLHLLDYMITTGTAKAGHRLAGFLCTEQRS